MEHIESLSFPMSFIGHVRNGQIIPDGVVRLNEGQAVCVVPINETVPSETPQQRAERLVRLQRLFDQWTEEDGQLTDEEADRLQLALERNQGVTFHTPRLD